MNEESLDPNPEDTSNFSDPVRRVSDQNDTGLKRGNSLNKSHSPEESDFKRDMFGRKRGHLDYSRYSNPLDQSEHESNSFNTPWTPKLPNKDSLNPIQVTDEKKSPGNETQSFAFSGKKEELTANFDGIAQGKKVEEVKETPVKEGGSGMK